MQADKQKVMIVIGSMEVGGTETHLTRVLPKLNTDRRHVRVVCFRGGGELANVLEEYGVEVRIPTIAPVFGLRKMPTLAKIQNIISSVYFLIKELRSFKPDIAHYFLPEAYILGGYLSLIFGPDRRVMSRRSRNFYHQRSPITRMEKFLHRHMDRILTNSRANLSDLKEEGAPHDRLVLCYNGINVTNYGRVVSQRRDFSHWGFKDDDFVITCVANLIPYKGHADIILALKFVHDWACEENRRPPKMLFVGRDSGIQSKLEMLVIEAGLQTSLRFVGPQSNVGDILSKSDMAILASHEEGMSNALLEYMCCSLPIVATDVGGNRETLGDAGKLVAPQSPEAIAHGIYDIFTNQELAKRLGAKARKRVAELFPISETIKIYGCIYDSL